jgi:hypothetical protein
MEEQSHGNPASGLDVQQQARIRAFIARVDARFTYAKTVPEHPHEYLARSWLDPELQADFDTFRELIREHGYRGTFWNQTWTYLDVDGWKYWESKSWFEDGGRMLNRARLDESVQTGPAESP